MPVGLAADDVQHVQRLAQRGEAEREPQQAVVVAHEEFDHLENGGDRFRRGVVHAEWCEGFRGDSRSPAGAAPVSKVTPLP
jgi:hypothetical protein